MRLCTTGFCDLREFVAFLRQRPCRCRKLPLDSADLASQPAGEGFFHFQLRAAAIEIVNRLSLLVEGNKPARRALTPQFTGNELYQSTFVARMRPGRIDRKSTRLNSSHT